MMNILFIGPYRQNDGWGYATRDYIKAIASNPGVNLTTRPLYLAFSNTDGEFNDQQILGYEQNIYDNYDMVVQKALPQYLFYDGRFKKNVGVFTLEISDLKNTKAVTNINRMDEIWVPSEIEKNSLVKSGVYKPVKVISQPIDIDALKPTAKMTFDTVPSDAFKLYSIFENNHRKNLEDLLIAFHLAFNHNDNVALIIKTTGNVGQLNTFSQDIKKRLQINKRYKNEIFITNRLSYQDIVNLHYSCDCFVASSYGEAFCRPAAEALCMGKNPIVNKNTGMKDYIDNENGFLVGSHKYPVILEQNPIAGNSDYYNANQYWYKVDIYDLISKMQQAYTMFKKDKQSWEQKSKIGMSSVDMFRYDHIGKKLCITDSK